MDFGNEPTTAEELRLDELVKAERDAYIAKQEADERHKKAKEALCAEIEATGSSWVPWRGQKVTVVRGERVVPDVDKLRSMVSAEVWAEITEEKVVTEKIRSAIVAGLIDDRVISEALSITTNAPYARYGKLEGDE